MPPPILTKERSKNIYGKTSSESWLGGTGDDYVRGGGGADTLTGGLGSDRFVFERTLAANGVDVIKDYTYNAVPAPRSLGPQPDMDVLDFSLVGFSRGALASGDASQVVRFVASGSDARVLISLDGQYGSFKQWALLENVQVGSTVAFQIGGRVYTQSVVPDGLEYDIGNGERRGPGVPDAAPDDDVLFDDALTDGGIGAQVLIGDRVRGFEGLTPFEPGVTGIPVPQVLSAATGDAILDARFQVYYGTYDARTDTFTVTSTPGTTADPRTATHTMVLYDNDLQEDVNSLEGFVVNGLYAKNQWFVDTSGLAGPTLKYQNNYEYSMQVQPELAAENVLYGTDESDRILGDLGVDIIYGGAGNDLLFGGGRSTISPQTGDDGGDWLTGGDGTDAFFVLSEELGGIDAVKDFQVGEALFVSFTNQAVLDVVDNMAIVGPWLPLTFAHSNVAFTDLGTLTGATLQDALEAKNGVNGGIVTESPQWDGAYVFKYDNKDYLLLDFQNNGYSRVPDVPTQEQDDDVVVQITGIGNLSVESIIVGGLIG